MMIWVLKPINRCKDMKEKRVVLIRHAETEGNVKKRYIGATDDPLCEAGIKRAGQKKPCIRPDTVYVTPLIRTVQTASVLFPYAELKEIKELSEMDFGIFENRSADEMKDDHLYRSWVEGGCLGRCPGGENKKEFTERVCSCFRSVMECTDAQLSVFVVHDGTIKALMSTLASPLQEYFSCRTDYCGGWSAVFSNGRLLDCRRMEEDTV